MPVVQSGCRPVQIKIGVDDLASSVPFYEEAFGLNYEVARRTQHHDSRAFVFGEYGHDNFFLLWPLDNPDRCTGPERRTSPCSSKTSDRIHTSAAFHCGEKRRATGQ